MNIRNFVRGGELPPSLAALNLQVRDLDFPTERSVYDTLHISTRRLLQAPRAPSDLAPRALVPCGSDAWRKALTTAQGVRIEGTLQLGQGGCGAVVLGVIRGLKGARVVALKESQVQLFSWVEGQRLSPAESLKRALREFDIMRASGSTLTPPEVFYARRTPTSYGCLYAAIPAMRGDAVDITNALRLMAPHVAGAWARCVVDSLMRSLARMHARGFVHADVKPENVLLDFEFAPHLSDYGLAAPISERQIPRGSVEYAAPEQMLRAQDPDDQFDDRADVYGLAITAIALLAQNPLRRTHSHMTEWEAMDLRRDLAQWHDDERNNDHGDIIGRRAEIRRRIQYDMELARKEDPALFGLLLPMLARRKADRPRMAWVVSEFEARGLGLSHTDRLTLHKALLELPVLPQARAIAATLRK